MGTFDVIRIFALMNGTETSSDIFRKLPVEPTYTKNILAVSDLRGHCRLFDYADNFKLPTNFARECFECVEIYCFPKLPTFRT